MSGNSKWVQHGTNAARNGARRLVEAHPNRQQALLLLKVQSGNSVDREVCELWEKRVGLWVAPDAARKTGAETSASLITETGASLSAGDAVYQSLSISQRAHQCGEECRLT